jgi:hypothetical protein
VRTRPDDVEDSDIVAVLGEGWRIRVESFRYVPAGGGGHHWKAVDRDGDALFVTVDDLDEKDWLGTNRDDAFIGLRARSSSSTATSRSHVITRPA